MTPLAMNLVSSLADGCEKIRSINLFDSTNVPTNASIASTLADMHCFECSEVLDLALEIFNLAEDGFRIDPDFTFLPASKTWIEYKTADGPRVGHLLIGEGVTPSQHYTFFEKQNCWVNHGEFYLGDDARSIFNRADNFTRAYLAIILGCLALINTPKSIGRTQYMPQRSLEKRLIKSRPRVGVFPLNAWTEIKLEARLTPEEMSEAGLHEAHLTGRRAYHFCRSHLRIRNGRLEFVKSHWRGDPSLGTKHSRYRITHPTEIGGAV